MGALASAAVFLTSLNYRALCVAFFPLTILQEGL